MSLIDIMPNISKLLAKTYRIETALVESEALSPSIEQDLFQIDLTNADSVEAYNFLATELESRKEFYERQADEFDKVAKSIDNLLIRYNIFVKKIMAESGVEDLHGKTYRFKLSTVKPKLVIDDEGALKADYSKTETKIVLDKERIKQDLELGVPVQGARLEQNYSLRKYPIKGLK